jgi:hypothetical protein
MIAEYYILGSAILVGVELVEASQELIVGMLWLNRNSPKTIDLTEDLTVELPESDRLNTRIFPNIKLNIIKNV